MIGQWLGWEEDALPAASILNMELGSAAHRILQSVTSLMSPKSFRRRVQHEVPVRWKEKELDFEISGRIDTVKQKDRHTVAYEYKTASSSSFKKVQQNGPYDTALLQCALYLRAPLAIEHIYLLYFSLDKKEIEVFKTYLQDGALRCETLDGESLQTGVQIDALIKSLKQLEDGCKALQDGKIILKPMLSKCRFCQYRSACKARQAAP